MAQSAASFLMTGPPGTGFSSESEKGESSRTGRALERAGESSVRLQPSAPSGETIKTRHAQQHIAQEEASFSAFLDSGDVPVLTGAGDLEDAWRSAVPDSAMSTATMAAGSPFRSVAEQEARDGADVVALLSDDGLDHVYTYSSEPISRADLARLREALFGKDTDHESLLVWDNVLNFIPEYLEPHAGQGVGPGDNLAMHFGTVDADEARQTWISQWSRLLTSYQDEVWGDLGGLVEEARTEVKRMEETRPDEKPQEPKALLRLRAILGHLRSVS
ncbi:63c87383-ce0a-4f40-836c-052697bdd762 [Thermothielavioides terrestris]|uniref:63c87383-ce0a-4f40-836c-052697bdd762 n=1 Tax=Thermothielavioides terrestris TaxID=2587410 RepID=A0A3S4ANC6_9PEZI|nr:63c87383-ce0a-4f40-836c-052697bdd762 [Thermothielavioides terrestris]